MGSEDIPGFDEDPELEKLLTSDLSDLDEDTLQDVQRYKSQKLKAKRDADCATDRPGWWANDASAPEQLSEIVTAGGSSSPDDEPTTSAETESSEDEPAEETVSESEDDTTEETTDDESDQTGQTEAEVEENTEEEPEAETEPEPAKAGNGDESVGVDISETFSFTNLAKCRRNVTLVGRPVAVTLPVMKQQQAEPPAKARRG
jgi:hypothetical protein